MIFDRISKVIGNNKWVMFANNTIVALKECADPSGQATLILSKFGPVQVGTPSGDMNPVKAIDEDRKFWLVSYPHCNHIFNIIRLDGDFPADQDYLAFIAMQGRENRVMDSEKPVIIYDSSDKSSIFPLNINIDWNERFQLCKEKATQGIAQAQYDLAVMHADGQGVVQNDDKAMEWYMKAADQGYVDAQYNLGAIYASGQGVDQNYSEAMKWYKKAAKQGDADAQLNLGIMYGYGQGVDQDLVNAYMWLELSAVQGNVNAFKVRNLTSKKMTEAQIEEGQRLAREWDTET